MAGLGCCHVPVHGGCDKYFVFPGVARLRGSPLETWCLFFFYVHVSGSHCLCVWVLPVEYRLDYSGDPGLLLVPTSTWTRIRSVSSSVCSPVAHCSHFESGQYFCDVHVLGSCVMMEGIFAVFCSIFRTPKLGVGSQVVVPISAPSEWTYTRC